MKDGRTEFKDLLYEAVRLINLSVKQYGKWDIEDIDKPIRRIIRKEPLFIPVDHLAEEDVQERIICHCIRCGRSIPSDHPYPYCGRCLESWKQYMNLGYTNPMDIATSAGTHAVRARRGPRAPNATEGMRSSWTRNASR